MKQIDNPYLRIESLCSLNSKKDISFLYDEGRDFSEASQSVQMAIESFKERTQKLSLMSLVLHFAKVETKDRTYGMRFLNILGDLIEEKLFPFNLTLQEFSLVDHMMIMNQIRMHDKWFLQKQEDYVTFYVWFVNFLSETTQGMIPITRDMDRHNTLKRKLAFEIYIELISLLPLRERILTKVFYLGGERTLDEVLALEIKHIDFEKEVIHFSEYFVAYPSHLFVDILRYLHGRKKGYVFVSKQGEKISHTVPYRALKVAVQKIGLPPTFTFKDLVKER